LAHLGLVLICDKWNYNLDQHLLTPNHEKRDYFKAQKNPTEESEVILEEIIYRIQAILQGII
jgi:hypothetical protein